MVKEIKISTMYNKLIHICKMDRHGLDRMGTCRMTMDLNDYYSERDMLRLKCHFQDNRPTESIHTKYYDEDRPRAAYWWKYEDKKRYAFLRYIAKVAREEEQLNKI